jgi:hypothetical protein
MNDFKLYMYYKDQLLCKWDGEGNDWEEIYKQYSKPVMEQSLRSGVSLKKQLIISKTCVEHIYKQKINCYKIRASDLYILLAPYFMLVKFGILSTDNFIFLKKKNHLPLKLNILPQ